MKTSCAHVGPISMTNMRGSNKKKGGGEAGAGNRLQYGDNLTVTT